MGEYRSDFSTLADISFFRAFAGFFDSWGRVVWLTIGWYGVLFPRFTWGFIIELLSPINLLLGIFRQVPLDQLPYLAPGTRAWLSGGVTSMPMFPLGSVLFPGMPLALRVFEERYLKMMGAILEEDVPQFGVVLIERGSEVGGGEKRFDVGTLAEVLEIAAPDGPLAVVARGSSRFRVTKWLEDDPYPMAEIELLDPLEGTIDEGVTSKVEEVVRDTLRYVEEVAGEGPWSADIDLSEDPEERLWQLAGISPLGPLDHQDFLTENTMSSLASRISSTVTEALEVFKLSQQGRENPGN